MLSIVVRDAGELRLQRELAAAKEKIADLQQEDARKKRTIDDMEKELAELRAQSRLLKRREVEPLGDRRVRDCHALGCMSLINSCTLWKLALWGSQAAVLLCTSLAWHHHRRTCGAASCKLCVLYYSRPFPAARCGPSTTASEAVGAAGGFLREQR